MQFLQHVRIAKPDVLRILRYQHCADCITCVWCLIWLRQPMRGLHCSPLTNQRPVSCQARCHSVASFCVSSFSRCQVPSPYLGLCGTHLIREICGCQKFRISREKITLGFHFTPYLCSWMWCRCVVLDFHTSAFSGQQMCVGVYIFLLLSKSAFSVGGIR